LEVEPAVQCLQGRLARLTGIPFNIHNSSSISCSQVIDFAATKLKVVNENRNPGVSAKLRLFKTSGEPIGDEFSQILGELIKGEVIYSGENLILEKSVGALSDLEYDFVV
jgi:hypothetical protein